jgi:tetratricopeptide (TPR) repeat protein
METTPSIVDAKQALAEKRIDDAIGLLREMDRQSLGSAEVYSTLGAAYGQKRDFQQSLACFEKALSLEPSAKAHFNLAAVQRAMGNAAAAKASLQAALNLDPGYDRAKQVLGQMEQAAPQPPTPGQFNQPLVGSAPGAPQPQGYAPTSQQQPFPPTMQPPHYGAQQPMGGPRPMGMPAASMFVPDRNWGKVIGGGIMLGIPALLIWIGWVVNLAVVMSPIAGFLLGTLIAAGIVKWFCSTGGDFDTVHWVVAFFATGLILAWVMAKGCGIFSEGWYATKKVNPSF